MLSEQVAPFFGNKKDENPENFMRSFYRHMETANDDTKKQQFPNFLEADSVADKWFDGLTQAEKKDWTAIETVFRKRWPRKKTAKKTTEEYEKKILDFRLKMEDLGKKETASGREVHAHITWVDDMEDIVRGAKLETTTNYISHIRKELPKLLREKVGIDCPRAGPEVFGPRAGPGPALKGQGRGRWSMRLRTLQSYPILSYHILSFILSYLSYLLK
jgi:hypothetical protein